MNDEDGRAQKIQHLHLCNQKTAVTQDIHTQLELNFVKICAVMLPDHRTSEGLTIIPSQYHH